MYRYPLRLAPDLAASHAPGLASALLHLLQISQARAPDPTSHPIRPRVAHLFDLLCRYPLRHVLSNQIDHRHHSDL